MSDLDLYDDAENLISSDDEFSEDDDDDLMNAAISSQNTTKSEVTVVGSSATVAAAAAAAHLKDLLRPQQTQQEEKNKLKAINLLMKRKKFSSFYKKRSIKWLNNKERREKYKEYLLNIKRKELLNPLLTNPITAAAAAATIRKPIEEKSSTPAPAPVPTDVKPIANIAAHTIELEDTDVELSPQKVDTAAGASVPKIKKIPIEHIEELHVVSAVQSKQKVIELSTLVTQLQQQEATPKANNKRDRSPTPPPSAAEKNHINNNSSSNYNAAKRQQPPGEKGFNTTTNTTTTSSGSGTVISTDSGTVAGTGTSATTATTSGNSSGSSFSLYREINEMFPKYDDVIGQHVKIGNSTIDAIGENMTRILQDIQTINDILQAKEAEWNRLLHLKNVKEEILTRLVRKKHILELRDKYSDEQARSASLSELKELEIYLSETTHTQAAASGSSNMTTAQQLLESRANMKSEDLEKERNNTNRLQSILISSNILPRMENSNHHFGADVVAKDNMLPKSSSTPTATAKQQHQEQQPLMQSYQYLENRGDSSNYIVGRQGPFKDVKSIIADFRQKNPDVLPRVGKRIKLNDPSSPTTANIRTLNRASYLSQPIDVVNSLNIDTAYDAGSGIKYTPTLEKLLSASTCNNDSSASIIQLKRSTPYTENFKYHNQNHNHHHNNDGQNTLYSLQSVSDDLCNEVSITPVISNNHRYLTKGAGGGQHEYKAELLRSALHANQIQPTNVVYIDEADHHQQISSGSKQNYRHIGIGGDNALHESDAPVCQECKTQEARFVCAGCGNQWYCSRSCQITAWDNHSDSCCE